MEKGNFNLGVDLFVNDELDEIDQFILGQKAKSTKYKDVSDMNIFVKFCNSINETRSIENIPEKELDNILCHFFMKALTKKGTLYEPDTLTSIRNSLQRNLIERGSDFNLREGEAFTKSRQVLAARRKQLVKLGKGNKPNAARPLTNDEVAYLYKNGYFGPNNAVTLQRALWWEFTTHFGHRARDEARQLNFGDIKVLKEFNTNVEYLIWDTERSTKTRDGARPMGHKRAFDPKAYATGNERCPVELFRLFVSHRPVSMCKDDSPLFLAVKYNINYLCEREWYYPRPLGKNSIGDFLTKARDCLRQANPNPTINKGKISNHSARKTSITNMLHNNINPLHVQQISGHKKYESLQAYNVASINQQKLISSTISRGEQTSTCNMQGQYKNKQAVSTTTLQNRSVFEKENAIPLSVENELMKPWDPVKSIFHGATLNNCTFNINIHHPMQSEPPKKRRRVLVIDDESDCDS